MAVNRFSKVADQEYVPQFVPEDLGAMRNAMNINLCFSGVIVWCLLLSCSGHLIAELQTSSQTLHRLLRHRGPENILGLLLFSFSTLLLFCILVGFYSQDYVIYKCFYF